MANPRGKRIGADDLVFEELVPCSAWTEDTSSHILLVDLPGFKKEELKLQVGEHGHVFVSGERQTNNNKIVHFKEKLKLPENSDIDKISGKYEGEVLYVIVPKLVQEEEEKKNDNVVTNNTIDEPVQNNNNNTIDEKLKDHEETKMEEETTNHEEKKVGENAQMERIKERWMGESGLLESATEMLSKNKGIVVTALLAFSLGVLLSQKFQSNSQSD